MPHKQFLEEYPLYKKFKPNWDKFYPGSTYTHHLSTHIINHQLPKPPIHMFCIRCSSEQTFNMSNEYYDQYLPYNTSIHGSTRELRYVCSACKKGLIVFLVYFGYVDSGDTVPTEMFLEKVGQIPPWSIEMDKNLESILGENAEYYKKGLICESQGYGIAAHAYYRRIVEDAIDTLLESIADFISSKEQLAHYTEIMKKVKETRVTQEKIELVKDLLPSSLCPNGINPLGILHSELSEGLHANSDEECLESADAIRKSLAYLAKQVMSKKAEHNAFTDGMQQLLDKKAKKLASQNKE